MFLLLLSNNAHKEARKEECSPQRTGSETALVMRLLQGTLHNISFFDATFTNTLSCTLFSILYGGDCNKLLLVWCCASSLRAHTSGSRSGAGGQRQLEDTFQTVERVQVVDVSSYG